MPLGPYQQVAVLMGGPRHASERDVSLASGSAVAAALKTRGYRVDLLDVQALPPVMPRGVEAAFVALHGLWGEDGAIQHALETLRVPYSGSGPESSRRCFDKMASKTAFLALGIPTPEYQVLGPGERTYIDPPLVTKPVQEGSSIGVHIVYHRRDVPRALRETRRHGPQALVERYIPGRELTVAILDDTVLPVVEIEPREGYFDYQAKYIKGRTRYTVPAVLEAPARIKMQQAALAAFHGMRCRGLARADFRMNRGGEIFLLEINTIPGFTETSLLPMAAAAAGIPFPELCDRIMSSAALECPHRTEPGDGGRSFDRQ